MKKIILALFVLATGSLIAGCNTTQNIVVKENPTPKEIPAAVRKRSYISDRDKVCVYSRMGVEEQIVIDASDICPLTLP